MKEIIDLKRLDENTVDVCVDGICGIAKMVDPGGIKDGRGVGPQWELSPSIRVFSKKVLPELLRDRDL